MRKIAIVLAVLFLTTAFAQATEIGFKAGLNLANVSGDVEDNDAVLTFGGGAFARFYVSPQFCIQPEVLYQMKGTKWEGEELGVTFEEKYKLGYLEIPVLFMYQFPMQGSITPSLFAGPSFGMLLSAKWEASIDDVSADVDFKDYLKTVDFGLVIGGGVDFKVGEKGKLTFDGRYTLGMANFNDNLSEFYEMDLDDAEIKNGVFSFFVGYAFPIGQ